MVMHYLCICYVRKVQTAASSHCEQVVHFSLLIFFLLSIFFSCFFLCHVLHLLRLLKIIISFEI